MTNPTADQLATGTTTATNEPFSVARYGTLVVVTISGVSDDVECDSVEQAVEEFSDMVGALDTTLGTCAAYAGCGNDAVQRYDFGPVGKIPTCQRCADRTDRLTGKLRAELDAKTNRTA